MAPSMLHSLTICFLLALIARSVATTPPSSSPSIGGRDEHNKAQHSGGAYIVFTDHVAKPSNFSTLEHWYTSMVSNSTRRLLHVYDTVMHGFAAELTVDEARRLSTTPGVTGVFKDKAVRLHTTRSPAFLGLDVDSGVWPDTDFGDGVIIGFVDTGIWPESASFNDTGLSPVRPTWKGLCSDGERFNASMCNNKLVGARTFVTATEEGSNDDFQSPRDKNGHGTHVSSTAAGSEVPGAGLFGFATGTARGVAPKAKIAMYKACDSTGDCSESAIAAAVDAAVRDGVDVLSLSLGSPDDEFYKEPVAIALFGAAVRSGVFVACSAGNSGPAAASLSNVAPWIATVGAATMDRVFPATVTLGKNGPVLTGQSLYAVAANRTDFLPLLVLPNGCSAKDMVPDTVMGKIVVCGGGAGAWLGAAVQKAGGSGLVSVDTADWSAEGLIAQAFTLPAVSLGASDADTLAAYVRSDPYPVASFRFTCCTVTGGGTRAPMVPSFSSRGPNHVAREILKPDVIAPGSNVLAAWPDESPLMFIEGDPRRARFNIVSGTSMSCPHVAGVAALLKRRHPGWSPAMVRSAMMTTAAMVDTHGLPVADNGLSHGGGDATPMAAGAGLVRPQQAMDPGLVYDAAERDYVDFLCTLNYTAAQVGMFVPGFAGCTSTLPGGVGGLNYPSFVADLSNGTELRVLTRTVTKVSEGGPETYAVNVVAPRELVEVTVTPATLEFGGGRYEKKSYTVVFRNKKRTPSGSAHGAAAGMVRFGEIVWGNDVHTVRSPVVFMF